MRITNIVLSLLFLPACKKDRDNCIAYKTTGIIHVRYMGRILSDAGRNAGAFFDVSCNFSGNCGNIFRFIEEKNGNTLTIKAEGLFHLCIACRQFAASQTKTYAFQESHPGTYYIKWEGLPDRVDTIYIP